MAGERCEVHFANGQHLSVDGSVEEAAEKLGMNHVTPSGYNPVTVSGRTIYVNREQVLYIKPASGKGGMHGF